MSDLLSTQPYKGTRDFYPEDMALRNWFFSKMREVAEIYGYEEYGGPIVESFDLYAAKSGEELVNEQIYHFEDKSHRRIAIRPEMTPTLARMVAARLEQLAFPLRWYTIANLMRYERPQKGRLREHWQLNVDILGDGDVRADAEILSVVVDLMRAFGADDSMFKIKVGNRRFFNDVLRDLLGVGDEEVRVISKAVDKRPKISNEEYEKWLTDSGIAPDKVSLLDEIFHSDLGAIAQRMGSGSQGAAELQDLFSLLSDSGLERFCEFDFSIVRGLDYYTGTVFEVEDLSPENRRALFGGGRYDNLIGLFKKSEVSGIGFGFGDVTFQDFLTTHNLIPEGLGRSAKVLIATFEDVPHAEYLKIASELRSEGIGNAIFFQEGARLKKQMKFAERKNFPVVIIVGPDELDSGKVALRQMASRNQVEVDRGELLATLKALLQEG